MGWIRRAVRWLKMRVGLEPRVIARPGGLRKCPLSPATYDEATVNVGRLSMTVRSSSDLQFPYELTVVVPRVEITERYVDGRLSEVISTYSSVTIARSPRFEFLSRELDQKKSSP